MSPTVYVIDDDDASREGVALLLETEGHRVRHFADAESFLAAREPEIPGCLVLDQRMPGMNGTDLQAELARRQVRMPIIFLSAFGDVPTTVRAMQGGPSISSPNRSTGPTCCAVSRPPWPSPPDGGPRIPSANKWRSGWPP